jgi:hypothetical protein
MNKSIAARLLIGRWKNSEENKKTVKKVFIFSSLFFSIDQSEAELQIVFLFAFGQSSLLKALESLFDPPPHQTLLKSVTQIS